MPYTCTKECSKELDKPFAREYYEEILPFDDEANPKAS